METLEKNNSEIMRKL
ncbi:Protein CBG25206 [Caenorhabditis briggsae]|uniref:Protein CBG25206 n=1 Tax=Caenorhabditis briggsae TaxID=6238 RepID=B6IJG4_CAEBR|nr:Protein CBG25206 [Caenorhabditis briggsae]CAS00044.1 Protein CBG25206 [Caenorhabditis briggsae]